jgi:hypothetical protein
MLLKKQTEDGIISALYASSSILASIYDTANGNLTITFKVGSQYQYANVSEADYVRFEIDDSQGIILNTHIKKYPFLRLANTDVKLLTEEISELKAVNDKAKADAKKFMIVDALKYSLSLTHGIPAGLTQDDVDTMFKDSLLMLQSKITDLLT